MQACGISALVEHLYTIPCTQQLLGSSVVVKELQHQPTWHQRGKRISFSPEAGEILVI